MSPSTPTRPGMMSPHGPPEIEVPPHIRGLIFDCDGTLVDSMSLHMEAWREALRQAGARYDHQFFYSKKGMKEVEIIEEYNREFHTALDAATVVGMKHDYFLKRIDSIRPLQAVVDVARRNEGVLPMAVVSGSVRGVVEAELRAIDVEKLFKAVLTADDRFPQKPAPDMFLEAARILGVPPHLCQVFEDGELGLLAARRAGMLATDVGPYTS